VIARIEQMNWTPSPNWTRIEGNSRVARKGLP
jgi:hypothetical protein